MEGLGLCTFPCKQFRCVTFEVEIIVWERLEKLTMLIYLKARKKKLSLWSLGTGAISLSCVPTVSRATRYTSNECDQAPNASQAHGAALQMVQNPSACLCANVPLTPHIPSLSTHSETFRLMAWAISILYKSHLQLELWNVIFFCRLL